MSTPSYHHCDVSDEKQVEETVNYALSKHGKLDILFSNAGIMGPLTGILDLDMEGFDNTMATNVRGAAATIKHAARAMVVKFLIASYMIVDLLIPTPILCKGISASALPYKRTPPSWLKISAQDVDENICKFAKKGLTPSQIGVILRDSHGIAQVKSVTGNKILRILKAHGLAPEIPEDLYHLIKKAVAIRKHLERNRKDKDSKFRLILVESRIHRLARYYKKTKKLPPVWKYESTTASTLVA
ncbi:hypothetical protein HS088_TW17G00987 [Tripterygium wilfordii]|uniref:Small ribosomal subunit protein uS15 N-terminal domain-containing protein n=1 Tax=Tripterygium wilfordii TaxID=458696 RepID=A0A7J7CHA2_TRIWF|nr:hypothetical protein HS088_TW17G00987 [Tripterygium wilfordii]